MHLTSNAKVRSQTSSCGTFDGWNGTETGFLSLYLCFLLSVLFHQHSIFIPSFLYSFLNVLFRLFIHPASQPYILLFVYSFIQPASHTFFVSFIHSSSQPAIHSSSIISTM